jgi:hypothetical protein
MVMDSIKNTWNKVWPFIQKNERHISTFMFVSGTSGDILKLTSVPITFAVYLLGGYTITSVLATIAEHYLFIRQSTEGPFLRGFRIFLAFLAEFMIGCLLSGILVFYARGAAITASWPFVLLLIVVLFGNEIFQKYRERLAWRSTLLFFTIYAYVIFTLPTLTHHLDQYTFFESTAVTLVIFGLFMLILWLLGKKRFNASVKEILAGIVVVLIIVNGSYFSGIIPPIPLALRDVGVYHSIVHSTDSYGDSLYTVQAETSTDPWWDFLHIIPDTEHVTTTDSSLSVYSAIFAPTELSTAVVHRWEMYDTKTHKWVTLAQIAFPIDGGRNGGYRGYSTLSNLAPGKYQVIIELISGQVIGDEDFNVVSSPTAPVTYTEQK